MAITFPTSGSTGVSGAGTTATSGTFSPGASTVLFVFVATASNPTFTISNTGTALTWTKRVELVGSEGGVLQIWSAPNTSAQTGISVTATADVGCYFFVKPVVASGVDSTTPVGATATDETNVSDNNYTHNLYTSTVNNSRGIAVGVDVFQVTNSNTPTSTDSIFSTVTQNSNGLTGLALSKSTATASSGTAVGFTFNCSNTSVGWAVAALEVLPAPEVQTVSPSGIASGEALGTAQVNLSISPTGISSGEALGTGQLNLTVTTSGIASAEAFGTADLSALAPSGISSGEAFGTPLVTYQQFVSPTGIASGEAVGTPEQIQVGYPQDVLPSGIASLETVLEPSVTLAKKLVLTPPSIQETPAGEGWLFQRYGIHRGISIVKTGPGVYYETRYPAQTLIESVEKVYMGGYKHTITSDEAQDLTDAGFGSYITLEDND